MLPTVIPTPSSRTIQGKGAVPSTSSTADASEHAPASTAAPYVVDEIKRLSKRLTTNVDKKSSEIITAEINMAKPENVEVPVVACAT